MPRKVNVRLDELRTVEFQLVKMLDRLERRADKFRHFNGYAGTILHMGDLRKDIRRQITQQARSHSLSGS